MEKSQVIGWHKTQQEGLTLIEVLIALAIIGIALTAIIKATSQNIRTTSYLQNKTVAMWVAEQAVNEARVGLIHLPNSPDSLQQTTTMLNQKWYWKAQEQDTPNKKIKKIIVKVFTQDPEEEETAKAIISLESFLYHEEA